MKPIVYTYKGRPLALSGKSMPRIRQPRNNKGFTFSVGFILLLLLAGAAWLGYALYSPGSGTETEPQENAESGEIQTPAADTTGTSVSAEEVSGPEDFVPAEPEDVFSPEKNQQILQIFSASEKAYTRREFEKVQSAMRLVLEKLDVLPGHHYYNKACDLLGRASMEHYKDGNDPANWVEYTVVSGDSLYVIAKRYRGVTADMIREENNLKKGSYLRIGQKLRIPQITWNIRIDRANSRILLDHNGRLFKIYPLAIGKQGEDMKSGLYRIGEKQKTPLGAQKLTLVSGRGTKPGIHGRNTGDSCFIMKDNDIKEFFTLVPKGTPAEILKEQ